MRVAVLILAVVIGASDGLLGARPVAAREWDVSSRVPEGAVWLERGRAAIVAGEIARAEACLMRSLLLSQREQARLVQIGVAFSEIERWREAEQAFRRSLRMQPHDAAALNGLGYVFYRNQRLEQAIDCYREAIALVCAPQYQLNLGLAFLKQERWGEAADLFRQVIVEEPLNYWAHNNLGFALDNLGFVQDAVSEYRVAAGISNGDLTALGNLGALFLREKAWEEAVSIYEAVLKLDDGLAEAHMGLAEAYGHVRRYSEARREAALAVALEPGNARAWYVKAKISMHVGRRRQALRLVLKSLERDSLDPDAHALCAYLARYLHLPLLGARAMQVLHELVPGDPRWVLMAEEDARGGPTVP